MLKAQADCDPNDPSEHLLWALQGAMAHVSGAPTFIPDVHMREMCKELYEYGVRHQPDLQTKESAAERHWLATPDPDTPEGFDLSKMSHAQKAAIVADLKSEGYVSEHEQTGELLDTAAVVKAPAKPKRRKANK